jgi:hypothetical protein
MVILVVLIVVVVVISMGICAAFDRLDSAEFFCRSCRLGCHQTRWPGCIGSSEWVVARKSTSFPDIGVAGLSSGSLASSAARQRHPLLPPTKFLARSIDMWPSFYCVTLLPKGGLHLHVSALSSSERRISSALLRQYPCILNRSSVLRFMRMLVSSSFLFCCSVDIIVCSRLSGGDRWEVSVVVASKD